MKRFVVFVNLLPWSVLCLIITLSVNSQATDFTILKPGKQLKDFDSLVSPNEIYALSFFYPNSSQTSSIRYLGIVFMRSLFPRYVWIANRENPLTDSSGILNLTEEGNLILTFGTEWNITINTVKPDSDNVSVTLSNSGNLVLRAGQQIVWQSFEQPTDTLLPGLQIGIFGLKTKNPEKRLLTSWLSSEVAFPGAFTLGVDPDDRKRLVIWERDEIYWRSGIWVRKSFGNFPSYLQFNYTSNENDNFTFLGIKPDFINLTSSCVQLTSSGDLDENRAIRISSIETPNTSSLCNDYGGCIPGMKPLCKSGEEFSSRTIEYSFFEWHTAYNYSIDLSYCQEMCEKNCHCLAYKTPQDGSGCEFFENKTSLILQRLRDARENGTQVYVRNSILKGGISKKMGLGLGLGIGGFGAFLIVYACCYVVWKKYFAKSDKDEANKVLMYELGIAPLDEDRTTHKSRLSTKRNHELPYFSFSSIRVATKNFDPENFLGQGGFGQVYKGTLEGGIEIAVKRLSQTSSQGVKEFENEVIMMSKLQHRNLVRLLGCCIHGEERMLIYEYLPNKSLDAFLFGMFHSTKRRNIDWKMRLSIIEGIAQGLLYLHKYSRSKIIHRDLKASNVLLDSNMNPKISDFGTARIFTENELDANTKSIVGTHGYMSPEFAMNGLFSEKSDVFSYGVMLLEIISGKQNIVFYHSDCSTTLLGIAWELWKEGQGLKLVESELKGTYSSKEVFRCIQIALLCVQESAADRPTISDVVSMLRNESTTLPTPEQPAFCNVPSMQDINKQEDSKTSTKSCENEIQIVNRWASF